MEGPAVGQARLTAAASDAASGADLSLDLELVDRKGLILQGDGGYSRKGAEPGNASYYVSLTRLATRGAVRVGDKVHTVEGLSWMDHEWSTSALAADQIGWDWFSIQLDDESELMVFQLRRSDGSRAAFSNGTLVAAGGATRPRARRFRDPAERPLAQPGHRRHLPGGLGNHRAGRRSAADGHALVGRPGDAGVAGLLGRRSAGRRERCGAGRHGQRLRGIDRLCGKYAGTVLKWYNPL